MNKKIVFSLPFSSVAKVVSRENASFFDRESFCRKICEKNRHSRKFMPLISRFYYLGKLSAHESFCP